VLSKPMRSGELVICERCHPNSSASNCLTGVLVRQRRAISCRTDSRASAEIAIAMSARQIMDAISAISADTMFAEIEHPPGAARCRRDFSETLAASRVRRLRARACNRWRLSIGADTAARRLRRLLAARRTDAAIRACRLRSGATVRTARVHANTVGARQTGTGPVFLCAPPR